MSERGQENKKKCIGIRRAGEISYGGRRQETRRMEGHGKVVLCVCQFNSGKPGVCNSPHVGGKHMQNGANEQKGRSLGKSDV